jgi:uncharacterized protein
MDDSTFDWDQANVEHLSRHNVTPEEAEEVVLGDPFELQMQLAEESGEERLLQLGETAEGRILQMLTTWRGQKVRVISAWDAPRQLRIYYMEQMRQRYGNSPNSEV